MNPATRLRNIYEKFFAGDVAPMVDFLAETVTYHLPGRHLGGGTLRSRDEVFQRTAAASLACDEPPRMQLLDVAGAGNFVVSVERLTARRGEKILAQYICVVWRIENDRCVEMWAHFTDQAACDAFWAD